MDAGVVALYSPSKMRAITKILTLSARQTRWSEGHVFAITPEQIGIVEGIRASLAVAVMLAADLQLHIPGLAYGAVAAFWTCLCDPGGSSRERFKVMSTFAVGATLAISLAAYAAHWGMIAGGVALFVLLVVCGLTRSYRPTFGPMPAPSGLIAAIAVVVGVASPRSAADALELAACFLSGAIWALVLCLVIWRTHPHAPARRALVAIFARLEEMAASLQQLDLAQADAADSWSDFNVDHRRAVRFSIERGRETVARLPTGRVRFTQGVDAAGRVFAALMALGHERARSPHTFDPELDRPLLAELRRLLHEAVVQADKTAPDLDALVNLAAALLRKASESKVICRSIVPHAVSVAAGALAELGRHWREPGLHENDEPEMHAAVAAAGKSRFDIPTPVWRHALRTAVATSISYALGAWFDVSFSYWGTIATLVLMQPLGANTWLRVFERAAGSMVGGVLTAILIARLSGPWEMLLFIAPLSAAVIAFRLVNYGLFVAFVTPMFVLVSDFIHPASNLIGTRAVNEAIGACIGLAGCLLLWPEKEKNALSDAILAAVSANMAFAAGVLRASVEDLAGVDLLRREAGVASSRAEIARQRMLLQGRSRAAHLEPIRDILAALRAICGATNILAINRQFESGGDNVACAARADRYDALQSALRSDLAGDDGKPASASLMPEESDDLERAVEALVLAVKDYGAQTRIAGAQA